MRPKKQNAPSPTALSSAGDFHEMKTGGIVVCSTLVALVYIPEYSYGRSVTHTFWAWPRPVWRMPPLRHGLVSYYRSSEQTATSLKAWFLPPSLLPPWSSSIPWVIPCSHVRVFARRLGR